MEGISDLKYQKWILKLIAYDGEKYLCYSQNEGVKNMWVSIYIAYFNLIVYVGQ